MKILVLVALCFASNLLLAQEESGIELFGQHCGACHRENGAGTIILERRLGEAKAVLEERVNLTVPYLRAVVRKGLGSMESISEEVLNNILAEADEELRRQSGEQ